MFFKKTFKNTYNCKLDSELNKYVPLFGTWLIDIAIMMDWHRPKSVRRWPDIFSDSDFCSMTGMEAKDSYDMMDDNETDGARITQILCRNILLKQRAKLQKLRLSPKLPLFKNVKLLAGMLELGEADQVVLTFAAGMSIFPQFNRAICPQSASTSTSSFCKLLSKLTSIDEKELSQSLSVDAPLSNTGLISINRNICDLEEKIRCMNNLGDILLQPHKNVDELISCFLRQVTSPSLDLDDFPHLQRDSDVLLSYLKNAVTKRSTGVNILIHGKPGVGKNEYVKALAKSLKVQLYEVSYSDRDGNPIKGEARLRAYMLCQRFLARTRNAMLMFDEVEDVFGGDASMFSLLFGEGGDHGDVGNTCKAWINRTMENNPVPAIWISNRVNQIDKAYLRRYDYSVRFPTPPHNVRISMARHHLDQFDPPRGWIERLSANEEITPGQYERAAKVAQIGHGGNKVRALELVENVLDRSTMLLGQRRTPSKNIVRTGYSLEWLNTDIPVSGILEGIKKRPQGTFCFYGAAGTGKSELARHMADKTGKQVVLKRASDILSPWVGVAEQNIAAMFDEARQQDAVLVLDEADSFLSDRRDAQRSWEVTQVNELLTQMEAFEGIFVCTTNLMTKLDQASLRRFAFKVRFDPLKPEQRSAMFRQELIRLGGDETEIFKWNSQVQMLEQLTPGDFAVATRQFELCDEAVTASRLYDILKKECDSKGAPKRKKIGFL